MSNGCKKLWNTHKTNSPHIIPVSLEDHDKISNVVCFDFAPALLSITSG
jgi:hypothetical protein